MEPVIKIFGLCIYKEKEMKEFFELSHIRRKRSNALQEIKDYAECFKLHRTRGKYIYVPKVEKIILDNMIERCD